MCHVNHLTTLTWTLLHVQCCFTSTETVKTIRDGEPRTTTSTFTQLLNPVLTPFPVDSPRYIRHGRPGIEHQLFIYLPSGVKWFHGRRLSVRSYSRGGLTHTRCPLLPLPTDIVDSLLLHFFFVSSPFSMQPTLVIGQ